MKKGLLTQCFGDENTTRLDDPREHSMARKIRALFDRVAGLKEQTKKFYFEVILSVFQCPVCGGRLHMTGTSVCSCSCGNVFDPTLAFQKSACCSTGLVRKTYHYVCSQCHRSVPSRFIFDERIFDKDYFREMMQESRRRKKIEREAIRRLLAEARSDSLQFTESPDLETIPGLIDDLNRFIKNMSDEPGQSSFDITEPFDMDKYRQHILSTLGWDRMLFSKIQPLINDIRDDKIYRFITLVFMDHEHEVEICQVGDDLTVQRRYNEAYA